jgi:hypothetical protein
VRGGTCQLSAPNGGFWERGKTDDTGYPEQARDGDDVQCPSEDDTPVQSPVV